MKFPVLLVASVLFPLMPSMTAAEWPQDPVIGAYSLSSDPEELGAQEGYLVPFDNAV